MRIENSEGSLKETYFLAAISFFFLLLSTMNTMAKRTIVGRNGAIMSIMPSMVSPPKDTYYSGTRFPYLFTTVQYLSARNDLGAHLG